MIQKSIYFKHITEDWRCSLVNEYYKKTLILLFILLHLYHPVRRYYKPGETGGMLRSENFSDLGAQKCHFLRFPQDIFSK